MAAQSKEVCEVHVEELKTLVRTNTDTLGKIDDKLDAVVVAVARLEANDSRGKEDKADSLSYAALIVAGIATFVSWFKP